MDQNPVISVVIPCYNVENYIGAALDSVLAQTYPHFEIICVDDGSADGTTTIIERYCSDKRIQLIRSEHLGGNEARNLGLKHAKGEFIQFLDADDVLLPEKFRKQLQAFDDQSHLVVSNYETWDADMNTRLSETRLNGIQNNFLEETITRVVSTNSPLYRVEAVKKIGGYLSGLKKAQDWEFHLRLALSGAQPTYLDSVVCHVRQLSSSVSSNWIDVTRFQCDLVKDMADTIRNHKDFNPRIASYLALLHYNLMLHGYPNNKAIPDSLKAGFRYWRKISPPSVSSVKALIMKAFGLNNLLRLERKRLNR